MATRTRTTGAPSRANVIPFPTRGGDGFRKPGTFDGCDRTNLIVPGRAVPRFYPEFDPHNAAHVAAWRMLCEIGFAEREAR